MKHLALALAAASMTLAGSVAVPTASAEAKARKYYTANGVPYWIGKDGRKYCRKSNGTLGTIVGGVGGALVGRAIDTRGERATGTIVGAVAGAVVGREIDRSRRTRCA